MPVVAGCAVGVAFVVGAFVGRGFLHGEAGGVAERAAVFADPFGRVGERFECAAELGGRGAEAEESTVEFAEDAVGGGVFAPAESFAVPAGCADLERDDRGRDRVIVAFAARAAGTVRATAGWEAVRAPAAHAGPDRAEH